METGLRFAAIDIGSNAMRLLFTRVIEKKNKKPFFIKESLIRMPLRLGHDAFTSGVISKKNCESFLHTMLGFKNLIDAYGRLVIGPVRQRRCVTQTMVWI